MLRRASGISGIRRNRVAERNRGPASWVHRIHSPALPMRPFLLLSAALFLSACAMTNTTAPRAGMPMAGMTAMTDADILRVFMASNEGEIVTSRAVLTGTQNADVRRFAQMMVDEHTAVNQRAMALDLDPRDNQVSASMTQNATAKAAQIGGATGAAKDRLYMETQVVMHGHTLDMLTNVLIPGARDPQLRALLTESRTAVERHFREAQRLHHGTM